MLIEGSVIAMLVLAWRKAGNPPKEVQEERKRAYENAMEHLTDPEKLRQLADEYQKQGMRVEASLLRKRANLRAMPKEQKQKYRDIFDRALKSENIEGILKLADEFEALTATGSAARLREHADDVKRKKAEHAKPFDAPIDVKAEVVEEPKEETPKVHGE